LKADIKNFSKPLGAQPLRLRQELRVVSLGPLAISPAKNRGGGLALPPASLPQVLHEASAIRASRLERNSDDYQEKIYFL